MHSCVQLDSRQLPYKKHIVAANSARDCKSPNVNHDWTFYQSRIDVDDER